MAERTTPPYSSFASIRVIIDDLAKKGAPAQIDASVLGSRSNGVKTQLLSAFRFLGIIDSDGVPTPTFERLAESDKLEYEAFFQDLITEKYPKAILDQLANGTPNSLKSAFDESYDKLGSAVRDRAYRFLVTAAIKCEMETSKHLVDGSGRVKGTTTHKSKKKTKSKAAVVATDVAPQKDEASTGPTKSWTFKLPHATEAATLKWPESMTKLDIKKLFDQLSALKTLLFASAVDDDQQDQHEPTDEEMAEMHDDK